MEPGMTRFGQKNAFIAGITFLLIRFAFAMRIAPRVFDDSAGYRWNGFTTIRPYGIAALFSWCGSPQVIVVVQTLLSTACWLWLFASLHRTLAKHGAIAHTVVASVAVVSLTAPIAMWDGAILSESLTLGLMAATVAAALDLHVRRWDRRSQLVFVFILVAGALVREIALVTFMLPIAAALVLTHRPHRIRRAVGLTVFGGLLSWASFIPAGQTYFQPGMTMTSFRNNVIIGCRILPDPFLKRRLEHLGMPFRPAVTRKQSCLDRSDVEMNRYALAFPFGKYVLVEASRPATLVRYVKTGIDQSAINQLRAYGPLEDVPPLNVVSTVIWDWSAELQTALSAIVAGSLLVASWQSRRRSHTQSAALVAFTSLAISTLGVGGAFLAVVGSSSLEAGRHAAPFLIVSRLGLLVAGITTASLFLPSGRDRREPTPDAKQKRAITNVKVSQHQ